MMSSRAHEARSPEVIQASVRRRPQPPSPRFRSRFLAAALLCILAGCGRGDERKAQAQTQPAKPAPTAAVGNASASAKPLHIESKADFEKRVLQGDGLFLVDFYADWCPPCKMLGPVIEELAGEMAGTVTMVKVNVDSNSALSREYKVRGIPHMVLMKSGKVLSTQTGYMDKDALKSWIEKTK